MTSEPDLESAVLEIIRRAIADLRAEGAVHPTGATIGARASTIASIRGLNLKQAFNLLQTSLAKVIVQIPEVRLIPRPRTDFYIRPVDDVGPAPYPDDEEQGGVEKAPPRLREDVFRAFTFYSSTPLYYIRSTDAFTENPPATEEAIEVPRPLIKDLVDVRMTFVETLEDESIKERLRSILGEPSPLASFGAATLGAKWRPKWNRFIVDYVLDTAKNWAEKNDIPFRDEWIQKRDHSSKGQSARSLLMQIANQMTDGELRMLLIPLGAVERHLQQQRLK